jgi:class 3 adenylate cyclase
VQVPEVRYAKTPDGLNVAYQEFGEGPWLVVVPPMVSNIEVCWEHELWRRVFEYHALHLRWVMFDKRGTGLSDPLVELPTLEHRVLDIEAVMDAVGIERAHVFGHSEGGLMAQFFAATRPERVDCLCMLCASPAPDQYGELARYGLDVEQFASRMLSVFDDLVETWGLDPSVLVEWWAPSMRDNESVVRWMARWQRLSASRAAFLRWRDSISLLTMGDAQSRIQAPTLIAHLVDDRVCPVANARMLHDLIPGSSLVEFPGDNHFAWVQDNWREMSDELITFLTGTTPRVTPQRRLATVMFTDIVDSTATAAAVGDSNWRTMMDSHDRIAWRTTDEYHGRIVKSTGDGVLATFETPSAAVACATDFRRRVAALGLSVRIGVHTGEIEVRPDGDVIGLAVNIAARVEQAADSTAILASSTVRDLLAGSGFTFTSTGTHQLKGIDGDWNLYAVT